MSISDADTSDGFYLGLIDGLIIFPTKGWRETGWKPTGVIGNGMR